MEGVPPSPMGSEGPWTVDTRDSGDKWRPFGGRRRPWTRTESVSYRVCLCRRPAGHVPVYCIGRARLAGTSPAVGRTVSWHRLKHPRPRPRPRSDRRSKVTRRTRSPYCADSVLPATAMSRYIQPVLLPLPPPVTSSPLCPSSRLPHGTPPV